MSGTLFIVCIPTSDKEQKLNDNDIKKNSNQTPKSFIDEKASSEFVGDGHKQGTKHNEEVCVTIEHCDGSISDLRNIQRERHSKLQRTKSCDSIITKENFLNVDTSKFKSRQSLDDSRFKSKKKLSDSQEMHLNILPGSSMELILHKIFQKLKIENSSWIQSYEMYSVQFSLPRGKLQDQVLKLFEYWGIGERPGSSITMLPCTVILPTKASEDYEDNVFSEQLSAKDQGLWDGFMNSANARMNVQKIVEGIRQDAALTFDYVVLIILAGIMAAFGLIENSIICLTSSMLISPLMGPLIAATFSTVIKDKQLMKFGVINELIGIFIATLVGFLFGLIVGSVDERYGLGNGLGEEILSRAEIHSLVTGVFTAIPSGAAVAIAILGENIGSLVGVAISASLLPPAVNAGLLWALASLFTIHRNDENIYNYVLKTTIYSENQAVELFILGSISMAVTIINVICIYGTGILFLKIKEVAPMVSKSQQQFWKHDVKVARDYNKSLGSGEGASLQQKMFEKFANLHGNNLRSMTTDRPGPSLSRFSNQHTWSPMMRGNKTSRMSIQELEKLYSNPTFSKSEIRPCRRLNRVAAVGRSVSPPKYQQLTNDDFQFSSSFRNRNIPTSPAIPPLPVVGVTKINPNILREINETPRCSSSVQSNKPVPAKPKPKFVVTPVDPLNLNKS